MHEIGQSSVPTSEPDVETFVSLRLAEPSERVNITLDERMLSIQGKRQATIDVRLNAIHTMKHHSTNLTPAWLMILGLALIWTGYRVMVPPLYRLGFVGLGGAVIMTRVLTKQPTLTMQTTSGDTHVVYGNERILNRLSFMFHHLGNGKSLEQVRAMLQVIESEVRPDWEGAMVAPAPELPIVIQTPQPLDRFLASIGEDIDFSEPEEEARPEWTPMQEPEPLPSTQYTSHLPGYFAAQAITTANRYPNDHRPAPVEHPVLLPVSAPPMHQGMHADPARPHFLPSFMGPAGAHIPQPPSPPEHADILVEPLLEAEQIEDALLEAELAPTSPPTPPAPQANEPLLRPRAPRSLDDTLFTPRRTQALRPNTSRRELWTNSLRRRSRGITQRFAPQSRPRPFGTTETSSALREQAEASRPPQPQEVMASLSEENGGLLDAETAARLQARTSSILAAAESIQQQQNIELDKLSFEDLQPSKTNDDTLEVPRLDED